MKGYRLILLTLALFSLATNVQDVTKIRGENKALYLISHLPEVLAADKYVRAHGDRRHLQTYIERSPTREDNHYYLAVAEDNGMCMVSHYKFVVDAKTYTISYWDVIADKLIPLALWRKNGSKRSDVNQ